ncbi:hypothetical protein DTO164E3_728 [Paecilomyces variotii]|nr:hypothetical protein DTO164E3_728 [Paecilomyces variotii]KAJ9362892.1 hypothetical protein DTO280E4_3241 [Paecilomyces variotii]KAJ9406281.1 hypothetical protein DTO045G8_5917 [Paecilomyces variotii]
MCGTNDNAAPTNFFLRAKDSARFRQVKHATKACRRATELMFCVRRNVYFAQLHLTRKEDDGKIMSSSMGSVLSFMYQSLMAHEQVTADILPRINLNVAIAGVMFAQIPQPPQYADAPDAKIPYELPVQAGVGRRVRRAKQDNIQLRGNKGQLVIDFARIPQEVNHMAAGEGKAQKKDSFNTFKPRSMMQSRKRKEQIFWDRGRAKSMG